MEAVLDDLIAMVKRMNEDMEKTLEIAPIVKSLLKNKLNKETNIKEDERDVCCGKQTVMVWIKFSFFLSFFCFLCCCVFISFCEIADVRD